MRLCFAIALVFPAITAPSAVLGAGAAARVHSDKTGDDFLISCQPGPLGADYRAATWSGVSPEDPYAVARGADKGLIRLMYRDGRRVKRFGISRRLIRSVVTVKLDQDLPDKVDMIYMAKGLMLIHTSASNAGIFVGSDVYRLHYDKRGDVDRRNLNRSKDLLQSLNLGLSFYQARRSQCGSSGWK
jgi:hypothetical protein